MKVAIVTNILTPYRIPLFEEMKKHVIELKVFLMTENEENRLWDLPEPGFATDIIPGFHLKPPKGDISLHFNFGLIHRLKRFSPDVVLSGGFAPANLQALLYCKLYRKPYVTWGELSRSEGVTKFSGRMFIRKVLCRLSDGAIASSTEAQNAFLDYGVPSNRLMTCLMPIPIESCNKQVSNFRQSKHFLPLKNRFSNPVLLSIGQITKRKGIAELFSIYESVIQHKPQASLVIIGEGPDRESWEQYVQQRNLQNVHFLGFVQFDQLPQYYSIADVFLFTTLHDPFGAVLLEAMAAKLPVASSIHAAATRDLIIDGLTGFQIDPSDTTHASRITLEILNLSQESKNALTTQAFQQIHSIDIRPSAKHMVKFLSLLIDTGAVE